MHAACARRINGLRRKDWVRSPLAAPEQAGFARWLLMIRRSREAREDPTACQVIVLCKAAMAEAAQATGSRWQVELGIEEARRERGPDACEGLRRDVWEGIWRSLDPERLPGGAPRRGGDAMSSGLTVWNILSLV